jgi:hypothetical protein
LLALNLALQELKRLALCHRFLVGLAAQKYRYQQTGCMCQTQTSVLVCLAN